MKFSVLSIHPEMIEAWKQVGLISKAVEKKILEIESVNIRDFSDAPHFRVDDKPYGGGPGMVLTCEPLVRAVRSAKESAPDSKTKVVVLAAKGKKFTQSMAHRFTKSDHLILVCGRYEGIDERVSEFYADEEIRIGDYVLMGGEVAAMSVMETVARLLPGVLGNFQSTLNESFENKNNGEEGFEYPQYTRPRSFEGREVPEVLLKGNHLEIDRWRRLMRTKKISKKKRAS